MTPILSKELLKEGEYVVRFKTPEEKIITFTDAIRGDISVSARDIDDKILFIDFTNRLESFLSDLLTTNISANSKIPAFKS